MKKKPTIAHLRNKMVWPMFSKYIRLKAADFQGYAKCVTCDEWKLVAKLQAGHFIPGRMNAIIFEERCVHPQCYMCNIRLKGNPRKYDAFMKRTYGQEVIDELDALSRTIRTFTYDELIDKYNYYKDEVKKLS